jgi:hypothetical protein
MAEFFEHPEYRANKENWKKWKDLYDADHETLVSNPDYLWPHTIEEKNPNLFRARKRRTRYLEIPEIVVSVWTSFFFRNPIEPSDDALELLVDFIESVDRKEMSFTALGLKFVETYLQAGKAAILVDAPAEGENLEPYASVIHPLEIKDWQEEEADSVRMGRLNMLRREYKATLARSSLMEKPREVVISDLYERVANNQIQVTRFQKDVKQKVSGQKNKEGEWQAVSEFTLALSEIPFVIIQDTSWIKGVCEETLRHFNLRSCRDNIQHQQGYTNIFIVGMDAEDSKAVQAISEYTWPILPVGASVTPISPTSTDSYDRNISEALMTAFKVGLNQMRSVASDSRAVQSAESIHAEKDERIALVESTRDMFSKALSQVLVLVAEFKGVSGEFLASLSFDLTEDDMQEFSQNYMTFAEQFRRNPEYNRLAFEKVLGKMFSEAELEQVESAGIVTSELEIPTFQNEFQRILEEDDNREAN